MQRFDLCAGEENSKRQNFGVEMAKIKHSQLLLLLPLLPVQHHLFYCSNEITPYTSARPSRSESRKGGEIVSFSSLAGIQKKERKWNMFLGYPLQRLQLHKGIILIISSKGKGLKYNLRWKLQPGEKCGINISALKPGKLQPLFYSSASWKE